MWPLLHVSTPLDPLSACSFTGILSLSARPPKWPLHLWSLYSPPHPRELFLCTILIKSVFATDFHSFLMPREEGLKPLALLLKVLVDLAPVTFPLFSDFFPSPLFPFLWAFLHFPCACNGFPLLILISGDANSRHPIRPSNTAASKKPSSKN